MMKVCIEEYSLNKGNLNRYCEKGYIALVTIMMIAVVLVVIGVTTTLLSINEVQSTKAGRSNEETVNFVDACAEDALLKLSESGTIPSSITLPAATCSVTINSQSGQDWDFTVEGIFDTYTKSIRLNASRNQTVVVSQWVEE